MLIQDHLGYELADAKHVYELNDIDFISKHIRGLLVSLKSLNSLLVPVLVL